MDRLYLPALISPFPYISPFILILLLLLSGIVAYLGLLPPRLLFRGPSEITAYVFCVHFCLFICAFQHVIKSGVGLNNNIFLNNN